MFVQNMSMIRIQQISMEVIVYNMLAALVKYTASTNYRLSEFNTLKLSCITENTLQTILHVLVLDVPLTVVPINIAATKETTSPQAENRKWFPSCNRHLPTAGRVNFNTKKHGAVTS